VVFKLLFTNKQVYKLKARCFHEIADFELDKVLIAADKNRHCFIARYECELGANKLLPQQFKFPRCQS